MNSREKKNAVENHSLPLRSISVWIDSYDDIFSDFDPRSYAERNISDDFLSEIKKFYGERESEITGFTLMIPRQIRDSEKEVVIVKRLNHYFKKNYQNLREQVKANIRRGIILTGTGILMMVLASYISLIKTDDFYMHTLFVVFEPAGWFLLWTGFELLFHFSRKEKPELSFYRKIIKSKISFISY